MTGAKINKIKENKKEVKQSVWITCPAKPLESYILKYSNIFNDMKEAIDWLGKFGIHTIDVKNPNLAIASNGPCEIIIEKITKK